jgi:WD40 repeat protein
MRVASCHLLWVLAIAAIGGPSVAQTPPTVKPHTHEEWKSLSEKDAEIAYAAMMRMAKAPTETIVFLGQLAPVAAAVDPKLIHGLVQQLSSARFIERDKAAAELIRLREQSLDGLTKAAEAATDLDTKRQMRAALKSVREAMAADFRLWSRALEVLEWIGTPDAKSLVETWSRGAKWARRTEMAHDSLNRWGDKESSFADASKERRLDAAGDPLPPGAVARLGTTRGRTNGSVFTAIGDRLVVLEGRSFRLIDIGSGKTVRTRENDQYLLQADLSPDGSRIVTLGRPKKDFDPRELPLVRIWNAKDLSVVADWPQTPGGGWAAQTARFARDGKTVLVAVSRDVYQCDALTGQVINSRRTRNIGPDDTTDLVAFDETSVVFATSNMDKFVVRNWREDKALSPLSEVPRRMREAILSPDGKTLAWAAANATGIFLYDLATARVTRQIAAKDESSTSYRKLRFSPDSKTLAFLHQAKHKEIVVVWDLEIQKVRWKSERPAEGFAFSGDSRLLVGQSGSRIMVWEAATGKELSASPNAVSYVDHDLGFLPDGRGLWTLLDGSVCLWDFSGKMRKRIALAENEYTTSGIVFDDARRMATRSHDSARKVSVRIWDLTSGRQLVRFAVPPADFLYDVAVSPNGKRLATWSGDAALRIWDIESGRNLGEHFLVERGRPNVDAEVTDGPLNNRDRMRNGTGTGENRLTRDGSRLLWFKEKVHLYDTSTGQESAAIDSIAGGRAGTIETSADGHWVVTRFWGSEGGVFAFDLRHKTLYGKLQGDKDIASRVLAISADGRLIAVACENPKRIHVFETASLTRRLTIDLGDSDAGRLEFSPGGRFLAAAMSDLSVLVYDLRMAR